MIINYKNLMIILFFMAIKFPIKQSFLTKYKEPLVLKNGFEKWVLANQNG